MSAGFYSGANKSLNKRMVGKDSTHQSTGAGVVHSHKTSNSLGAKDRLGVRMNSSVVSAAPASHPPVIAHYAID